MWDFPASHVLHALEQDLCSGPSPNRNFRRVVLVPHLPGVTFRSVQDRSTGRESEPIPSVTPLAGKPSQRGMIRAREAGGGREPFGGGWSDPVDGWSRWRQIRGTSWS